MLHSMKLDIMEMIIPNVSFVAVVSDGEGRNHNFDGNSTVDKAQYVDVSCYPLIPV